MLLPALLAFVVSALGTGWARRHGRRKGLLDQPGARRSHQRPTPRGGGIGIAMAGLAVIVVLARTETASWYWVGAGLLSVSLTGWRDDHRSLPILPRLVAHLLAGILLAVALLQQGHGWTLAVLAILLVPALVNAWNFIDGIDGLAASQAGLCALASGCVLAGPAQALAWVVAAACAGFLPFNVPVARIFLGDVGSGALGYLMAVLLLSGFAARPWMHWPLLLLPMSAVLLDAGLTLVWRIRRGDRWWQPHVQHLYQRAARRAGHARITAAYAGWTGLAIGIMLALLSLGEAGGFAGGAAFILLTVALWFRLHRTADGGEGFGS
ncbi:MAG: hypothetical protein KGL91_05750 [Xanthomonadaceae bacterium]|nr:hypothetical protein [Xanthomonadaceae bacterium]